LRLNITVLENYLPGADLRGGGMDMGDISPKTPKINRKKGRKKERKKKRGKEKEKKEFMLY
jgi:hypothetical protein